jgi:hypothetical protein
MRDCSKKRAFQTNTQIERLWHQEEQKEARELLTTVYEWFAEGFDIADLKRATLLLDQLTCE